MGKKKQKLNTAQRSMLGILTTSTKRSKKAGIKNWEKGYFQLPTKRK